MWSNGDMNMLATLLAVMALADPVTIISGVHIGDSPESVQRIVPGQLIDIVGSNGLQMIHENDRTVTFCNRRVVAAQVIIGRNLHDFTDSVQDETANMGDPWIVARHHRTASGQISTINAEWEMPGGRIYSYKLIQTENGPIDVAKSLAMETHGC
jgi:hypothetical protein